MSLGTVVANATANPDTHVIFGLWHRGCWQPVTEAVCLPACCAVPCCVQGAQGAAAPPAGPDGDQAARCLCQHDPRPEGLSGQAVAQQQQALCCSAAAGSVQQRGGMPSAAAVCRRCSRLCHAGVPCWPTGWCSSSICCCCYKQCVLPSVCVFGSLVQCARACVNMYSVS